jgi:transposase
MQAVADEPSARQGDLGLAHQVTIMDEPPSRCQSGETDRPGAITKAGNAPARLALFDAAHVLMIRVARWFPLKAWDAGGFARRREARRSHLHAGWP